MISQDLNKTTLPDAPGVYFFLGVGKQILYIGKATSLKDRVRSYFSQNILNARGVKIHKMLEEAKSVKFIKTDSVLEALMLEASLIKKHQPIYNSKEKDDRSYNYTTLTKEDFPKVVVTRGSGMYFHMEEK
jgi:excinuclease ABC subunit C